MRGALLLAGLLALPAALVPSGAEARSRSHSHRIHRDPAQRRAFMREHPCPGGRDAGSTKRCRGYVVDHVKALKHGGADRPSNMAWQSTAEAKAKDRWE